MEGYSWAHFLSSRQLNVPELNQLKMIGAGTRLHRVLTYFNH